LPAELDVLTEVGLEWRGDIDTDPRYLGILNLDDDIISPVTKIKKTIPSVAGNRLAKDKVSAFRIEQHLQGHRFQSVCLTLVDLYVPKKSVTSTLGPNVACKEKDEEQAVPFNNG